MPVEKLVPIPHHLTAEPVPAPAPQPAFFDNDQCRDGCLTNRQIEKALQDAWDYGRNAVDQLRAIRSYSDTATAREPAQ